MTPEELEKRRIFCDFHPEEDYDNPGVFCGAKGDGATEQALTPDYIAGFDSAKERILELIDFKIDEATDVRATGNLRVLRNIRKEIDALHCDAGN